MQQISSAAVAELFTKELNSFMQRACEEKLIDSDTAGDLLFLVGDYISCGMAQVTGIGGLTDHDDYMDSDEEF